ncbi:hypothetical protein BJY59DRAFT_72249 [Rhodotorula toruloides]
MIAFYPCNVAKCTGDSVTSDNVLLLPPPRPPRSVRPSFCAHSPSVATLPILPSPLLPRSVCARNDLPLSGRCEPPVLRTAEWSRSLEKEPAQSVQRRRQRFDGRAPIVSEQGGSARGCELVRSSASERRVCGTRERIGAIAAWSRKSLDPSMGAMSEVECASAFEMVRMRVTMELVCSYPSSAALEREEECDLCSMRVAARNLGARNPLFAHARDSRRASLSPHAENSTTLYILSLAAAACVLLCVCVCVGPTHSARQLARRHRARPAASTIKQPAVRRPHPSPRLDTPN